MAINGGDAWGRLQAKSAFRDGTNDLENIPSLDLWYAKPMFSSRQNNHYRAFRSNHFPSLIVSNKWRDEQLSSRGSLSDVCLVLAIPFKQMCPWCTYRGGERFGKLRKLFKNASYICCLLPHSVVNVFKYSFALSAWGFSIPLSADVKKSTLSRARSLKKKNPRKQ